MQINGVGTDALLRIAIECVTGDPEGYDRALDVLPVPMYLTDPKGMVTYYNPACVAFTGRVPELYQDQWCITAKLYSTDGNWLLHEDCPMAVAIKEQRPIRGVEAVAERPDGSRVPFRPYPTPIFDEEGQLVAAINMLVDVTERKHQAEFLRVQAEKSRNLADKTSDPQVANELRQLAQEHDAQARILEKPH
ncbi:MAG: hypothetical protein JWM38_136 [Sphingomonas bacterium]|jgi:PAS domain S-box-containing protein|nr:hypothetical protein [Sphingomonas bacterium]MDB5716709.1 hypothetical protein [Sphingomonas bacterium]